MKVRLFIFFAIVGGLYSVQSQTATNDFYTVSEGSAISVPAPGVLSNDTGERLAAILIAEPANGTLTLNTNGSFVYTPTNDFVGADNFTYRAVSGSLTSAVATATIMVTGPGELFHDSFTRPTDNGSIFPWVNQLGTWGITNAGLIGTCSLDNYGYAYYANASWTNYSVQAQIRYSTTNAWGGAIGGRLNPVSGARYTVWVYPENSPGTMPGGTPSFQIIKYETWTAFTAETLVALPAVGTNWHTVRLAFQSNTVSAYFDGSLVTNLVDNGSFDGQPAYVAGGIDAELYTQSPTTYNISVDNVIVSSVTIAHNDTYTNPPDSTLSVGSPGVLANDMGNAPLTALLVSGPTNGSLTLTNNGGFSYSPTPGFVGNDNFSYQITDGQTTSAVATVAILVPPPPPIPIMVGNDAYTAATNTAFSVPAPGVLANDGGGVGPLTTMLANEPAYGGLTLTNNGGFSYTPTNDFTGVDLFDYRATDGQSTSSVATAAVVVVPANQLFYDSFVRPTNGSPIYPWIVKAASPSPEVVPNPSGIWTITNNTFKGHSTSFYTYTLAYLDRPDWTNYSIRAQVSVPTNSAVGTGLGGRLNPQTGARYAVWMKPENAPDGPPNETGSLQMPSVVLYKYSDWTTFKLNEVVVGPVGTNQHTLNVAFQGNIITAYFDGNLVTNWVDDGSIDGQPAYTNGGVDVEAYAFTTAYTSSVSNLVVEKVGPLTLANNDTYTSIVNTTLSVGAPGVLANDVSWNESPLTALLANGPAFGSLTPTNNGGFSYTPATNFVGMDTFSYRATDGQITSAVANVQINVLPPGYLFYDDFKRAGNSNNIFPWANELGSWSITNGVIFGTCNLDDYGSACYRNDTWTDYAVQAAIRYPASNVWGGAVGGRLNPITGARYTVWVYPENSPWGPMNGVPAGVPTMQIIKYENWTTYTAKPLVPLPAVGTNWHNVKLAFKGNSVAAYFDDNLITNLIDNGTFDGQAAYTNGGISIGMYAQSPTAYTLSVSNVEVLPLVFNPHYSTGENVALTVASPGVLSGDTDVYGTNLVAALVAGPTNGTLNLSTNGGFVYTPSTNFIGTDGFTFQAGDNLNNLGLATATITVLPGTNMLNVIVNNTNRMYGATNPVFTVSYSGFVNGDTTAMLGGALVVSSAANANSAVGNYPIVASGLSASNYVIDYTDGVLIVTNALLTVSANNTNKVYGTGLVFLGSEFTVSGLVSTDSVSGAGVTLTSAGASAGTAAGSYEINITNLAGEIGLTNYLKTYVPGTLTVNPADLTVSVDNQERGYGRANPVLTGGVSANGDGITASFMVAADTNSAVGEYPIAVSLNDSGGRLGNYTVTTNGGVLTVTNALLTVTAESTNKEYGTGLEFAGNEFTVGGLVSTDYVSGASVSSAGAGPAAGVGSYAIEVTNAVGDAGLTNYQITYVSGTLSVGAAGLEVSAHNTNRVYGATNPVFTVSYSDFVNGEGPGNLGGTLAVECAADTNSPVGEYAIVATGLSSTNYLISYTNGVLSVTNALLTVSAQSTNKGYGQLLSFTGNDISVSGLVSTDYVSSASVSSLGTGAGAPAGVYAINVTNAAGDAGLTNYLISYEPGTLTVGQSVLGISANSTNRVYGATNPVFTVSYSDFVNGEGPGNLGGTLAVECAADTNSPVGEYAIVATGLSSTNYLISYTNGTLTVNPATLTVTAEDKTRMYAFTNPVLTASFSGFVNDEDTNVLNGSPALSTSANPGSPVGDYPITITQGTLSNANYGFLFIGGTLKVTLAPAPVITSIDLTNGAANVTWTSLAGATYQVQYNDSLDSSNWIDFSPDTTATNSTTVQTNIPSNVSQRFYRVVLLPP